MVMRWLFLLFLKAIKRKIVRRRNPPLGYRLILGFINIIYIIQKK
jgi:hypothetical protein